MPTIFTHAAPALAAGAACCPRLNWRLLCFAVFCAILPDFDVIGFKLGVQYADFFGHRGFSHSLFFACLVGMAGWIAAPLLQCRRMTGMFFGFFGVGTHIALDAMTSGGLGVAALWPLSDQRYFLPWRPIAVSPFSPRAFLSERGLRVIGSELFWVWLPCVVVIVVARVVHMQRLKGEKCGSEPSGSS